MYEVMLIIIVMGLICAFAMIAVVYGQHSSEIQKVLQLVSVCTFLAFCGYAMELTGKNVDSILAGVKVGYMGKCFVIFLYMIFLSKYGKIKITSSILKGAFAINTLAFAIIMTCEYHKLYYTDISYRLVDGYYIIETEKGWFYYAYMVFIVLMFGEILEISYKNWKNSNGARKQSSGWLFVASLCPGIALCSYLLRVVRFFDLTPIGLLITCTIIIMVVKRYGILNAVQVAQEDALKNSKDGMVIVDDEYNLLYANQVANKAFPELGNIGSAGQQRTALDSIFQETESVAKFGDRHYEIRVSELYEDKALRGYLAWIFDMEFIDQYTNEIMHLKEEAERANQAKSTFLANMSHEIRTPMNAVMGLAELILQRNCDSVVNQYATDIKRSSKGLLNIINEILDISKIEAGKLEILEENYTLQNLLNETLLVVAQAVNTKGLQLITHFQNGLPNQLNGDVMRIRQILVNILNNAVKYTKKGHITFTVTCEPGCFEWVYLKFSVKDTGVGIKEEDKKYLFEQFEQVDVDKNKGIEGTGLGLSIVKELLNLMHGTIEVRSEYGKGSEFLMTIPQKKVGNEIMYQQDWDMKQYLGEEERILFYAKDSRVLVVDDNDLNLQITKGLLKNYGIQTDLADGGLQGVKMALEKDYDIIFMDCMMPEMDGTTAMKQIKEQWKKEKACPPIVALTANAIVGVKEELVRQGFTDYMSKPIQMNVLESILVEYIPDNKLVMGEKLPGENDKSQLETSNMDVKEEFQSKIESGQKADKGSLEWYKEQVRYQMDEFDFERVEETLDKMKEDYPESFSQKQWDILHQAVKDFDTETIEEMLA